MRLNRQMTQTGAIAAALLMAATGLPAPAAAAPQPLAAERADSRHSASLPQLRRSLYDLADRLAQGEDPVAVYADIVPAAREARERLSAVVERRTEAVPQADAYAESLDRLLAEVAYLRDVTGQPGYSPRVLDTPMFLNGALDEWSHAVRVMADRLTDAAPGQGEYVGSIANVSASSAPGTAFRDRTDGPELVVVEGGTFVAGATDEEHEEWGVPEARRHFELPQRTVTVDEAFAIGATEVTVGQFRDFVEDTGYEVRGGMRWWEPFGEASMDFDSDLDYLDPGFEQTDEHPAVGLTRQDAEAYAEWLSETTGETYRLPTEVEWEWAARGGSDDTFYWGDGLDEVDRFANTFDVTAKKANGFVWDATDVDDGFAHTAPVASFEPNGYGLYDVTGNAREFTADSWADPLDLPGDEERDIPFPVLRGGAWNYQPQNLRLDYRSSYYSSEAATNMFGFRLIREL